MSDQKPPGQPMIVLNGSKPGPAKAPLAIRKVLSDRPHHHRAGEPDIDDSTLGVASPPLPVEPLPQARFTKYEREMWDQIVESQQGPINWLRLSDAPAVMVACRLWGRLMEIRDEVNARHCRNRGHCTEDGDFDPRAIRIEAAINTKFLAALTALGMVPGRRSMVLSKSQDDEPPSDGLLH